LRTGIGELFPGEANLPGFFGAIERLGLGYDDLAPRFPRLVYASSKGYGHDSRFAQLGAMDFTIQAASGIISDTFAKNSVGAYHQPAAVIVDTTPLATLPAGALPAPPTDPEQTNLAYRNLTRAFMVKLATGQQMVALLKSKGVTVTALTDAQIRDGAGGADLGALTKTQRARVLADTPLWFYILREAELNGGKLTGVGGRIVAETFHRAIEGSKFSIIRAPNFTPTLGPDAATFRMVDLILFACNGQVNQINPLGN